MAGALSHCRSLNVGTVEDSWLARAKPSSWHLLCPPEDRPITKREGEERMLVRKMYTCVCTSA